ncbi:hypothetical protein HK097_001046 [Rhizophlyctis rosea]|uniref:Cyclin-like domain-containing protein n=1 Tax=Rhizophlyctis rosea TaxID=64517 RepID=A0AAD5X4H4_9FUNG|nr:hypothetical protein HK097_001046 [Rhizophlyctis rosea]
MRNDDYTFASSDSENHAPILSLSLAKLPEPAGIFENQDALPTPATPFSDGADSSRDSYFTDALEGDSACTSFSSSTNRTITDDDATSDVSQEDPLWCDEEFLSDDEPPPLEILPTAFDDEYDTENVRPIHTPRVQTPITGMSPNVRHPPREFGPIPPTPGLQDTPFRFCLSPSFGFSPKLQDLRSSSRPHSPVRAESRPISPRFEGESALSSPAPARLFDFQARALEIKPGTAMRPILQEHLGLLKEVADIGIVFEQWECDDERETFIMKHRRGDWLLMHPRLNQQYRWILINWMNDVANEHRLQRRTFHIAVNYLDIYMSKSSDIQQDTFQLLGAAMLFIAAKMELLDWDVAIPNANDYLLRYFQQAALYQKVLEIQAGLEADPRATQRIMRRQFHGQDFADAAQRLDDAVTDYASVKFRNSVLAASVFHLTYGRSEETFTELITSYSITQLRDCIAWVQELMMAEGVSDASSDAQPTSELDTLDGGEAPDVIDHQPKASKTLVDMMQVWDQCDKGMG